MVSASEVEFTQLSHQLNCLSRRDITQGLKLAKFKKSAGSMLKKNPVAGNTLLGLIACLEHDIASMHDYHKRAVDGSESCFSLMYYALSLEKSCLWNESAKYALSALDQDPGNLKLLDAVIRIAPLTGRFSLLKRLLAQRRELGNGVPHHSAGDYEIVNGILCRNGLLEKDLKAVVSAIGDALAETDVILQKHDYELVTEKHDLSFIHYRFVIPDQFVASYYEDLIAAKLDTVACHPRIFDAFSYSVENSTVYELYNYMERELEESADTIRVPDPDKMKLIEELVQGVEI
ncbi:MAG: hypothetical protein A2075_04975 [Geobacteraceae bacterium GWC2_58_44]|nr:MAG: hypothetical protein A2075_04975 [Geobacteraceae bacterium GWC2_58_44]HBG07265.1 hypothetical protein [Geobacter sp.]